MASPAEQPPTPEASATMPDVKPEILASSTEETSPTNEAQIESNIQGNMQSSGSIEASSSLEKTLEKAAELMEEGSKAIKDGDFSEATDCLSRALEIRVAHYGELAPECASAYYKYGCALLYKAQEETDPLGNVPKETDSLQGSAKDESSKSAINGECSTTSVVSDLKPDEDVKHNEVEMDDGASEKVEGEDDDGESDGEDLAEADEDDSDLDLAWKMLDIARAIVEKNPEHTMEKVDILSALGEVALEREDIETSISDYLKALSILECLVEPDSRQIAELNFRVCLCLEVGSKPEEAIPYCQKAISICKARLQRLMDEVKISTSATGDVVQVCESSSGSHTDIPVLDKEAEIKTLTGLSSELEKKLEDLQQLLLNPSSVFADVLKMFTAKAMEGLKSENASVLSSSQMGAATSGQDLGSPTVSTGHTNGSTTTVTHLGVVGRGVKRAANPTRIEPSPLKKPGSDSEDKGSVS